MKGEDRRYLLWLSFATGCEVRRSSALLQAWGSAKEAFDAARLKQVGALPGLSERAAAAVCSKASEEYIGRCIAYLKKKQIGVVAISDDEYPELLRQIYDPPLALFVRGKLRQMELPIAVVGSRNCTEYGKNTALEMCRELADAGASIISGLALGIDGIAAQGALESNSKYPTVAVLPAGVDRVYPASNEKLYYKIAERGAVISEMLPGTPIKQHHFPRRNRIISGIARGVAVMESGERSGTAITVDFALEQGRDVFAVPGRIGDSKSAGTNRMIAEGMAKMVLSAQDILAEYGVTPKRRSAAGQMPDIAKLTYEQALICKLLEVQERSFDELCVLSGFSAAQLNSNLTELEFSGIIKQSSGRTYQL